MSIYTKTGDKGTTSLFDSVRVKKYSLRVDTYGTFDECIAQLSVAEKMAGKKDVRGILIWIQKKLFLLNAEVATSKDQGKLMNKSTLIQTEDITQMEEWIDIYLGQLPEIHQFILPGSCLASAQIHVARTVCRRGERRLIELSEEENLRPELLQFVNRLSDCIYVLARVEDFNWQEEEIVREVLRRYQERMGIIMTGSMDQFNCLQEVFRACIQKAEEIAVPMCMTVVDSAGHLMGSYRMPDTLLVSTDISLRKAYTAVAMKAATGDLSKAIQPGAELYHLEEVTDGKVVTFGGGFPIYDADKKIIGGIGISGGSVAEDEAVAKAGLKRFKEINS